MMTTDEMVMYDMIVDLGIATSEELNLARNLVSGSWTEVMDKVVDIRTGYSDLQSYIDGEYEDEE